MEQALVQRERVGACPICGALFVAIDLGWSRGTPQSPCVLSFLVVTCTGPAQHTLQMGKSASGTQREEALRAKLKEALSALNQLIGEDGS